MGSDSGQRVNNMADFSTKTIFYIPLGEQRVHIYETMVFATEMKKSKENSGWHRCQ